MKELRSKLQSSLRKKIKVKDLAYIAGFIDGEGCIRIAKRKQRRSIYPRYILTIVVGNTNILPLRFCKRRFGGKIKLKKMKGNRFQAYHWVISGKRASRVLERLLPYFIIKKKEALLGLKFQKSVSLNRSTNRLLEKVRNQRERMFLRMKLLKIIGKGERGKTK